MKQFKGFLALAMAVVLCFGLCVPSFAADTQAKLYNVYGDNMLFEQNTDAILAGTGKGGDTITVTLLNADGQPVAKGKSAVNRSGVFYVSFPAPAGSYDTYTVVLAANDTEFARLKNVVFGELWLASGQSNMQMGLGSTVTGQEMRETGTRGSEWLRLMYVPAQPTYKGDINLVPADPQREIPGCYWMDGTSDAIFGVSAVAFFFGDNLQKSLDMPVGVLCTSLGGSSIYTWLSRNSIDGDAGVKSDLSTRGWYYDYEAWDEAGRSAFSDMTCNYNKQIAPLQYFSPVGMIWYQGETNVMTNPEYGCYTRAMELMQRSYSELFGFEDEAQLPLIFTQLAAYKYGDDLLQGMNVEFSDIQQRLPQYRATTTIYDVPLTFNEAGTIHPADKLPVGQKMVFAAEGLVYGKREAYTAATVSSAKTENGSVYVTLRDVGDGLKCKGNTLYGFAVCGADGVYVSADAEIVSADTVRIWSDAVPNPVSATYAFSENNCLSNLFASENGACTLGVSPFITDKNVGTQYWKQKAWADCESMESWQVNSGAEYCGFRDTWTAKNAALQLGEAHTGEASLRITSSTTQLRHAFSVSPAVKYWDDAERKIYPDWEKRYNKFGKITFAVRNNGSEAVTLDQVRFYTSAVAWYAPAIEGTDAPDTVIPADGAWHEIALDMNKLYLFGNECGPVFSREVLKKNQGIELCFKDNGGSGADVCVDTFRFTPDGTEGAKAQAVLNFGEADSLWEAFTAIFLTLYAKIFVR